MKPTPKPLFFIIILVICIACSDYYYNHYKSLFYPETIDSPKDSWVNNFYYSSDYFFNYDASGSWGTLSVPIPIDSMNILEWSKILTGRINHKIIRDGLYNNGKKLLEDLNKIGLKDAATYLTILKRIDTLQAKEGWGEADRVADIPNLLAAEKELAQLQSKTQVGWLKDRILYARLKALRFATKNKGAISLYEKEGKNQTPGLIADMTRSMYAGAFYPKEVASSYYEFSKLLRSNQLGYLAPYNVRVFDMPFNDTVLSYCKNNTEKADVHAIAAMQTKQNLPFHVRKVHAYDPQHPYLPLLVSRMINKYEDFYQVNNDKDRYWWSPEDSIAYQMPNKMLDSVIKVAFDITKTKKVFSEPFYAQAMAHLFYTKGDIPMSKLWNSMVMYKSPAQKRQKYVQELLNFLAEPKEQKLDILMLSKIESLASMSYGRDVHVMQTVSKGLCHYFGKDIVKVFYARALSAITYEANWETNKTWFENGGWEQQQYLDTISTKTMSAVIKHLEDRKYDQVDSTLMKIANLSADKLYLAYARRLMMEDNWFEGKKYFDKMSKKYFETMLHGIDANYGYVGRLISYEEPILWLKSHKQIPIKDHTKFLARLSTLKTLVTQNPNDPKALYDYGLQQYNLSYWGSAWIYCKSHRYSSEDLGPTEDINTYYGCDQVAKTLDHAIKYSGTDKELHGKIVYLRALVEKAQAQVAIAKLTPENYWEFSDEEQKKLDAKSKKLIAEKYSKYGQYFVDKVADSEYKRMIIKECEDIRKLSSK